MVWVLVFTATPSPSSMDQARRQGALKSRSPRPVAIRSSSSTGFRWGRVEPRLARSTGPSLAAHRAQRSCWSHLATTPPHLLPIQLPTHFWALRCLVPTLLVSRPPELQLWPLGQPVA